MEESSSGSARQRAIVDVADGMSWPIGGDDGGDGDIYGLLL